MTQNFDSVDLCVHLKGYLTLINTNGLHNFSGQLYKGLRLIFWGNSIRGGATSSSLLDTLSIDINETRQTEIVILNSQSIDKILIVGDNYSLGTPNTTVANFKVKEIVGIWKGKVP